MWTALAALAAVIGGLAVLPFISDNQPQDAVAEHAIPEAPTREQAGGSDASRSPFESMASNDRSDATAADRAKSRDTLGLLHSSEMQSLIVEGVLMPGSREGTYYLSEIGIIYKREERRGLKAVAIIMIIIVVIGVLLIPIMARGS